MSKSRSDQRKHRRKAWKNGKGAQEHAKREKRRKRDVKRRDSADREIAQATSYEVRA